jgi:predicted nucleotidyltransferase
METDARSVSVILAAIKERLAAEPSLRLAVLFGSTARAQDNRDSDLDIAILPMAVEDDDDHGLPLSTELRLQADLASIARRDVDLVRLDRAATLMKWRIARDGLPLLERAPFAFARFVAHATSEHLDYAPAFAAASARFRKRLAERAKVHG